MSDDKQDTLKDLIELVRTTRQGFTVREDLEALSVINNQSKKLRSGAASIIRDKNNYVETLRRELRITTDKISKLSTNLEQSQSQARSFANRDQLIKDHAKELQKIETQNEEMKREIDKLTNQLVELQMGNNKIPLKSPSISNIIGTSDTIEDSEYLREDKAITMFDDIVVDAEEDGITVHSEDENDINYYKLQVYKSMDIILDPDSKELFISRKDGKVDVMSLDDGYSDYYNTKFIWEKLTKE